MLKCQQMLVITNKKFAVKSQYNISRIKFIGWWENIPAINNILKSVTVQISMYNTCILPWNAQ